MLSCSPRVFAQEPKSQHEYSAEQEQLIELPSTRELNISNNALNQIIPGVSGTITSVGSDTLATLMSLWAEAFKAKYPHVKFQIQATGSSTAPQALTQGTANLGPMSRQLTQDEINRFIRKYGYPPTVLRVAIDAIAIFVERNNPLRQLTSKQVDALFSATRLCGGAKSFVFWSDLGITKFGQDGKVVTFGRNSSSGTHDLFKQQALCKGDYKASVNELSGSASIVRSIASSIGGIGYAALGERTPNVRGLSIGTTSTSSGQNVFVAPTAENITAGTYPFSRYLYVVVNKPPTKSLPVLERSFLAFILSTEGQKMVEENGYYPIQQAQNQRQLRQLLN